MRSVYVSLPTVRVVQRFVAQISKLEGNFDLQSGKYVLDAKSLMGILSLDLSKPHMLTVEKDTDEAMSVVMRFAAQPPETGKTDAPMSDTGNKDCNQRLSR